MNYKRHRCRLRVNKHRSGHGAPFHWPAWWDRLHHTRPTRRHAQRLLRGVLTAILDPDDIAWPLASHKPHDYYW